MNIWNNGQNVEAYDINKNTWSLIKPNVFDIYANGAVSLNDKLYIIGDGVYDKGVLTYDPKTSIWGKIAEQPELGFDFATVALNDSIYIISGERVYKFNPSAPK